MEEVSGKKIECKKVSSGVRQNLVALSVSLALAFVCITICSTNSFLYTFNDWADTNWFLSMGQGILDGKVPYKDLFEQKGVLIYALFALACLIDDGFLGVYLIEIIFATAYLYISYKILRVYKCFRFSLAALAVVAAVTYCSAAFVRGGGAVEEFCLPMLAYGLYTFLIYINNGGKLPVHSVILCGVCAGCIFWIKYTLLAFYLAFAVCVFVDKCLYRNVGGGTVYALLFILGLSLASVPWLVYLGLNSALGDMWQVYIIDNIFSYAGSKTFAQIAANIGKTFLNILKNFVLYVFAFLAICGVITDSGIAKKYKAYYIVIFASLFLIQCVLYGSHLYYHLAVAIYLPFALAGLKKSVCAVVARVKSVYSKLSSRRAVKKGGRYGVITYRQAFYYYQYKGDIASRNAVATYSKNKAGYIVLGGVLFLVILLLCGNCTAELANDESDFPQLTIAEVIEEDAGGEDYTLLCYKITDNGFYTACGISPDFYYFALNNFTRDAYPELYDGQESYVTTAQADYVITELETWEQEKDGALSLYKELDEGAVYTQLHRESNFNSEYRHYVVLCVA